MIEVVFAFYLLIVAALVLSDVTKGFLDFVLEHPNLRQAFELVRKWYLEQLKEELKQMKARQAARFENCTWERCEAVHSGAGKAIAMK